MKLLNSNWKYWLTMLDVRKVNQPEKNNKILCVIPARGGSKTVPGKNIKFVCGKPLLGYAIESVLESNVFDKLVLSTDSKEIAELQAVIAGFQEIQAAKAKGK